MKKYGDIIPFTFIVFVLCILSISVMQARSQQPAEEEQESKAWEMAIKNDTINTYASFLKKFPNTIRKDEIRKLADSIMVRRVSKEIKENNAEVSQKGLNNSDTLPIMGLPSGGTMTIMEEVDLASGERVLVVADPTNPIKFEGVVMRDGRSVFLKVVEGRGIIIQDYSRKTYIYVFGIDLSSVVSKWIKW
jgi:hypothetical protein